MKFILPTVFAVVFLSINSAGDLHAALPFTAGNLAVLQATASANNTTCSILELNPAAAGAAVNTVAINGTANPGALRFSGSATSTGYLADSDDGSLLVFTGAQTNDTAANANTYTIRGVGTLNNSGMFALQAAYLGVSGNQTRCATSINNSAWYVGDQGGVYTNNSTTVLLAGNVRSVRSFGGSLYLFTATTTFAAPVLALSNSGTSATPLPGLPATTTTAQDFYLVSSGNNGSAYDVLYILSASSATAGTIAKFSLVSGSWVANGSYTTSFGGFGLAAAKNGSAVSLYVTTGLGATTANSVIRLTDTAGYDSAIAITTANNLTLFTTAAGTILKGIAFAPAAATGKITPAFSDLTASRSILAGTASIMLAGTLSASGPVYPGLEEHVIVTINGTSLTNTFSDGTGDFALSFPTATIPAGTYPVACSYPGNATLNSTANSSTMLTVTNPVSPVTNSMQLIQTVFVIALENHNFTQPTPDSSPEQLLGNPAAPYLNSLITPGNPNAAQVSYAPHYYNVGVGVHGSEANYIWSEAGSDFGVHTSSDPSASAGNIFSVPHLTAELNAAGIPWRDYQEDVQYSASPIVSASGSGVAVNPYNGTTEYLYAVKHNPMAFFSDTGTQNVYALTNFLNDLTNNQVGRYNWITPDEYNEMHSSLPDGFTYHGVTYNGDQAAVAEGDNFLSIEVPQIMASQAYRSNGVIIIWSDETEGGDTTNYTIPEIIISPLARGNAYASPLEYSHSSDLRTMLEIFRLNFFSNTIPSAETRAAGSGYNNISTVNDFADLFINYLVPTSFTISQAPAGGLNLSFLAATNQPYRILTATAPNTSMSNWTLFASGTVTTNPVVVTATNASRVQFYRVAVP